jgi:hypothetical protein
MYLYGRTLIMTFYVKYGLYDVENDVKFSKLGGTEIK